MLWACKLQNSRLKSAGISFNWTVFAKKSKLKSAASASHAARQNLRSLLKWQLQTEKRRNVVIRVIGNGSHGDMGTIWKPYGDAGTNWGAYGDAPQPYPNIWGPDGGLWYVYVCNVPDSRLKNARLKSAGTPG